MANEKMILKGFASSRALRKLYENAKKKFESVSERIDGVERKMNRNLDSIFRARAGAEVAAAVHHARAIAERQFEAELRQRHAEQLSAREDAREALRDFTATAEGLVTPSQILPLPWALVAAAVERLERDTGGIESDAEPCEALICGDVGGCLFAVKDGTNLIVASWPELDDEAVIPFAAISAAYYEAARAGWLDHGEASDTIGEAVLAPVKMRGLFIATSRAIETGRIGDLVVADKVSPRRQL